MNTEVSKSWLDKQCMIFLRWSVSVYRKLFSIVPANTTSVVGASLVAQISLLLAFFLPLKIILLIGSPSLPRYFPAFFADFDMDKLAFVLSLSAIGFYILYQITDRLIETYSERGASLLLERSSKLTLFANQEEITKQAYKRFSGIMASALFVGFGLLALMFIYSSLSGFLIALILFFYLIMSVATTKYINTREWVSNNISDITNVFSAVFFLSAFAFIVADFIWGDGVNIIIAIISLLLSRQMTIRLTKGLMDAIVLTQQRPYIDALFFHGKALIRPSRDHVKDFWGLLDKKRREAWVKNILEEMLESMLVNVETIWHEIAPRGVTGLDVTVFREDANEADAFFIKLYDHGQRAQAIHEATLLRNACARSLPAPVLKSTVAVGGYQCLVFDAIPSCRPKQKRVRQIINDLVMRSWCVEPPVALVNRYRRSKPILVDRLGEHILFKLYIAFNTQEEYGWIKRFESALDEIKAILIRLPLFLYNPYINSNNIRVNAERNAMVINWGTWSLEPIGTGWPTTKQQLQNLDKYLHTASEISNRLSGVYIEHVRLAALMFAFERQCLQENYLTAIGLLPSILECLEDGAASIEPDLSHQEVKL